MVSPLLRSSLREIRQSLGRYLAILAIVALGVGFFAGLRMCEPDMKETGIRYLDTYRLHDIRLLSTLGFTEEDVAYYAGLDGIEAARGSVYTEFLYRDEKDEEIVLLAHSLTDGVNEPELVAGRMPENGRECLGDARYFSAEDIGQKIRVSEENDEDTLELLVHGEYTLVGVAHSPLYLNYERGTASIGNGSVAAFVLIPEEGFDFEAYYEVFLTVENAGEAYSEAYDDRIDEIKATLEPLAESRARQRYLKLYKDARVELRRAEGELADGWEEYNEGYADYQEGLAEYNDGWQEYSDGLIEIGDAERELADSWSSYWRNKPQADAELAQVRAELEAGEAELTGVPEQLEAAKQELAAAKSQLDQGEAAYAQATALYQSGQALAGAFGFSSAGELLAAAEQDPMVAAQLDAALQAQGSSLDAFRGGWYAAAQALGGSLSADSLAAYRSQLDQGEADYSSGYAEYEANRKLYESSRAELDAGWKAYYDGAQELENAYQMLLYSEHKLNEAKEELEEARIELEDAALELTDAEEELAEAKAELDDGEQELADAYEELESLREAVVYVLTRNENVSYAGFDNDTNIIKAISIVFPVFFFLVAALVCMTTMTRLVDEQRTQIGVLKALGYSNGQIMGKYILYSGSAAVAGSVVGYAIGSIGMPLVIWEIYDLMYGFAPLTVTFDPLLALISFAAAMLCSVGVTFLACRVELTRPAAELIRPKAPKAGKRVFLEYVTPVWRRLTFLQKVSVRNVFRYHSRLVMMLLGIGGCTALLVTGYGIQDSVASIADEQYEQITLYDYSITFRDGLSQEDAAEYLTDLGWTAEDGLRVCSENTDLEFGGRSKSAALLVSSTGSTEGFIALKNGGTPIPYPAAGEAVISRGLAESMGIRQGDTVTLCDDDLNTVTVTVSGIADNYMSYYVYIAAETYQQQTGREPEYKTLYLTAHPGADPYVESVSLSDSDDVISVSVSKTSQDRLNSMLSRMSYVVVLVVICAAALAFVVLYNLTNINISERIREIATIKVLGFYHREVSTYVFRETYILAALGSLLGLALGKLLHLYVMAQVKVDGIFFPCRILPVSYLYSLALTILFTVLITMFMRRKLRNVHMAESLKSIE